MSGLACSFCFNDRCKLMNCSSCHRVSYCSTTTCQIKDWEKHKIECKMYLTLTTFLKPIPISSLEHRQSLLQTARDQFYPNVKDEDFRILDYEKICAVCFKGPYHTGHNAKEWYSCDICQFGWCFSRAHWEAYAPRHTPASCALYKELIENEKFYFEQWEEFMFPFAYWPNKIPSNKSKHPFHLPRMRIFNSKNRKSTRLIWHGHF